MKFKALLLFAFCLLSLTQVVTAQVADLPSGEVQTISTRCGNFFYPGNFVTHSSSRTTRFDQMETDEVFEFLNGLSGTYQHQIYSNLDEAEEIARLYLVVEDNYLDLIPGPGLIWDEVVNPWFYRSRFPELHPEVSDRGIIDDVRRIAITSDVIMVSFMHLDTDAGSKYFVLLTRSAIMFSLGNGDASSLHNCTSLEVSYDSIEPILLQN